MIPKRLCRTPWERPDLHVSDKRDEWNPAETSDVVLSKSGVSWGHSSLINQMRGWTTTTYNLYQRCNQVRQLQKTERQADCLTRIGLENWKYTRACSTDYGEDKGMSVTIQDLVLDRNNLN